MIERIRTILNKEDISASKLAEKIGVQRSSISHILSERNKPSLEFIQKICEAFPSINSEWLLTGKGGYLKTKEVLSFKPSIPTPTHSEQTKPVQTPPPSPLFENIKKGTTKKASRIVTFYNDGTFEEHFPS